MFRENLGDELSRGRHPGQEGRPQRRGQRSPCKKALDILEKLVDTEPEQAAYHAALGRAWNALGFIYDETCDNLKAVPAFEKAVKEQENAIAQSPDHNEYKVFLCMYLENLAEQYLDLGSSSLMPWISLYNLALKTRRKLNDEHPKYRGYAESRWPAMAQKSGPSSVMPATRPPLSSRSPSGRIVVEKFLTDRTRRS